MWEQNMKGVVWKCKKVLYRSWSTFIIYFLTSLFYFINLKPWLLLDSLLALPCAHQSSLGLAVHSSWAGEWLELGGVHRATKRNTDSYQPSRSSKYCMNWGWCWWLFWEQVWIIASRVPGWNQVKLVKYECLEPIFNGRGRTGGI